MKKTSAFFMLLVIGLGYTVTLDAMPAFARKYQMSCKTCHNPFPRLKLYGEEFAGNGFVLKDKDAPRYTADTGDDKLSLIRDIPIALRLEGYLAFNNADAGKLDFAAPYLIKLLSGGAITKNIAYYFYFFFSERGEVAGLEDAFLMFNELFGSDLDLYIGQFQVSDPLFKRELRLPFEDYQIYRARPGSSRVNLAYDRGIMLTCGIKGGPDLTLEVLNGSGINAADDERNFDNDKYKNFFARASQSIGEHLRVGAFGYLGREGQQHAVSDVWLTGVDVTWTSSKLELNWQYVERRDENPFFMEGRPEIATRGGFAELIYLPRADDSPWYGAGLFNWVDSEQDALDYTAATLHGGWLLRRNFRLVGEGTYMFRSPAGKYLRASVGLVTGF